MNPVRMELSRELNKKMVGALCKVIGVEKDVLLSYPYESIKPFINLLYEAARDDSVVSIKMTLSKSGLTGCLKR